MLTKKLSTFGASAGLAVLALSSITTAADKPLKVFILAGQSNMQGKARVRTIERLNMTDDGKQMYQAIMGEDGNPTVVPGVHGVYFTSGRQGPSVSKGPLSPSYGEPSDPNQNFGPEYTFGIYMREHVKEPFLIIKTAWGGKNLLQQFRPPSAGEAPLDEAKAEKLKAEGKLEAALAEHHEKTGEYYRLMMKHVKEVLADPGQYHPAYDKEAGYEIAGFAWFQGFNDLVNGYYKQHQVEGGDLYAPYSKLMATFIRDVRKDLKAPAMPFVIGVIGIGGPTEDTNNGQYWLRKAQEAPAALPEFKGNVAAVRTEHCWDMEWQRIDDKARDAAEKRALAANPELEHKPRARANAVKRIIEDAAPEVLTAEEQELRQVGRSNAAYHYNGSAYILGRIGKAFADAMAKMMK
jgi:alpha-galactosidase